MTGPQQFRNHYFALRHGISIANEEGVIVSDPSRGVSGWGLSPAGREDAIRRLSPEALREFQFVRETTLCVTSDFLRAKETAGIFCRLNGLKEPVPDERLRERFFGSLEGKSNRYYDDIWERDNGDEDNHYEGCESPRDVAFRVEALIHQIEKDRCGLQIVLVSHGDTLQIAGTIFLGLPPNRHRSLPDLKNAEMRRLNDESTGRIHAP